MLINMWKFNLIVICLLLFTVNLYSQKVGVVFSGGGAKGLAHLGVIKALEENNVPIDYVTGTSMGSIVGSLYAMGYSVEDMVEMFSSDEFFSWYSGETPSKHIYQDSRFSSPYLLEINLEKKDDKRKISIPISLYPETGMNLAFMQLYAEASGLCDYDFDKLFVPLRTVATNISKDAVEVFDKGQLSIAVRTSMTFPMLFAPLEVDGDVMFDGGILNNFPVDVMQDDFNPGYIIGSKVSSNYSKPTEDDILSQMENMITVDTNYEIEDSIGVVVDNDVERFGLMDFYSIEAIMKEGYESTMKMMPQIKSRVDREVSIESVQARRDKFKQGITPLMFSSVTINGVNENLEKLVRSIMTRGQEQFDYNQFKIGYYQLLADNRFRIIRPYANLDKESGTYNLTLDIITVPQVKIKVGGVFSNTMANEFYLGAQVFMKNRYSSVLNLDAKVGKLHSGINLDLVFNSPNSKGPFITHFESYFNSVNLYDEYSTFPASFESSLEVENRFAGTKLSVETALKRSVKLSLTGGFESRVSRYLYDSETMEARRFEFAPFYLKSTIERYALDDMQFATKGHRIHYDIGFYTGNLTSDSGKDAVHASRNESFWTSSFDAEFYQPVGGPVTLGFSTQLMLSHRGGNIDRKGLIASSYAFAPFFHSKTLFTEELYSDNFFSLGLKPIVELKPNLFWRSEAYLYSQLRDIEVNDDGVARYDNSEFVFNHCTIFNTALVYKSSQGPFQVSWSYYPNKRGYFTVSYGYLLYR